MFLLIVPFAGRRCLWKQDPSRAGARQHARVLGILAGMIRTISITKEKVFCRPRQGGPKYAAQICL